MTSQELLDLHRTLREAAFITDDDREAVERSIGEATRAFARTSVQAQASLSLRVCMFELQRAIASTASHCGSLADDLALTRTRLQDGGAAALLGLFSPLNSTMPADIARYHAEARVLHRTYLALVDAFVGALACPETGHPAALAHAQARESEAATRAAARSAKRKGGKRCG